MNGDDGRSTPEWPIRPETDRAIPPRDRVRQSDAAPTATRKRGINPVLLALGGLLLLLLLLWLFTGNRSADQDKLTGNEAGETNSAADPEKRCASQATYDLIKRDIFRRAAQVRGSDQGAFDRLAAYAAVRMENPVLESESSDDGGVTCSGSLSIDLPPGVQVVGGRRTLSADVDYSLRRAADSSGDVVTIRNADAIVTPLATLARTGQAAPQTGGPARTIDPVTGLPTGAGAGGEPPMGQPQAPPQPAPVPIPAPPAPPQDTASARPSFNCANASTRGERAVCSDSGLASLDRQMASQFNRARSQASASERALLDRTRGRFLSYRDGCRSDDCIADAYRGRMREISDIMAGRWQPR
jgi:uncharacterized protein YecT (DUF1311 family)